MSEKHESVDQLGRLTNQLKSMLVEDSPQRIKARQLIHSLSHELDQFSATLPLSAYDQVKLSRHPKRPTSLDLIPHLFDSFLELHGDRYYRDDTAMICGIAMLNGMPITLIAQQKGRNLEENLKRNFGMSHPEGYRKAKRAMEQAQRFGRPVITLIDTPGAFPGIEAEERGQASAIAQNLYLMSTLRVPLVGAVIGEGGSGGALGIGVVDRLIMLENAIYSVISPEGCAAILWKDSKLASQAAEALRLTSHELARLGIADLIVKEPQGGAHSDLIETARLLKDGIWSLIEHLVRIPPGRLIKERTQKYRQIGLA